MIVDKVKKWKVRKKSKNIKKIRKKAFKASSTKIPPSSAAISSKRTKNVNRESLLGKKVTLYCSH